MGEKTVKFGASYIFCNFWQKSVGHHQDSAAHKLAEKNSRCFQILVRLSESILSFYFSLARERIRALSEM